jgi:CheY-like chemotaxis protein
MGRRPNRQLRLREASSEKVQVARILTIDDDATITGLLRMMLEAAGHEVLIANDGSRGFALAQRQHPDVILLDVMMKVMSGTAVLRTLAGDPRTAHIPVVMLSALSPDDVGGIPDDVHVAAYVRKPFDAADLVRLIAEITAVPSTVD